MKLNSRTLSTLLTVVILGVTLNAAGQAYRLDNLKEQFGKGRPIKFTGALNANGIGYRGDGDYGRSPFS